MLMLTASFRDVLDSCLNIHQIEISCYHVDHAMSFLFRTLILTLKFTFVTLSKREQLLPSRTQFRNEIDKMKQTYPSQKPRQ